MNVIRQYIRKAIFDKRLNLKDIARKVGIKYKSLVEYTGNKDETIESRLLKEVCPEIVDDLGMCKELKEQVIELQAREKTYRLMLEIDAEKKERKLCGHDCNELLSEAGLLLLAAQNVASQRDTNKLKPAINSLEEQAIKYSKLIESYAKKI